MTLPAYPRLDGRFGIRWRTLGDAEGPSLTRNHLSKGWRKVEGAPEPDELLEESEEDPDAVARLARWLDALLMLEVFSPVR